jgi:FkbM family methyltransferase
MTSSDARNAEFEAKFTRESIIRQFLASDEPLFIDIGAHRGETIQMLRGAFPQCTVLAVEANPSLARDLQVAHHAGVHVLNCAVAAIDGEADFYVNEQTQTSSLYPINLASRDSIAMSKGTPHRLGSINTPVRVQTRTLDSIVSNHGIETIDLLKIDVQGAEVEVLLGGKEALQMTRVISLEVALFDFYGKSTTFFDVEALLHPAGFHLFSVPFVSQNPMNGRTDWLEAIYVRDSVASSMIANEPR